MSTTTSTLTQKDLVHFLDSAAQRDSYNPASSKQTWFLAGLIIKNAPGDANDWIIGADCRRGLSKKEASSLIDLYLNGPFGANS